MDRYYEQERQGFAIILSKYKITIWLEFKKMKH